ncbi:GerMN domain-containing protein [uncultured Brachyspira sp.]|uniref:GerMN domain-containing protein n=1 Tax=uncultured Brachyspira sp. TaxID=221953 RepID=UPI002632B52E|nr:GerMN domain-containing protein [uncultured Brachyspira sp.]
MPRYEQLKAKSKGISYTRQIRNESKEINLKKPLIISVLFIIIAAVIFTTFKKYSPMVDIAIKDFFSINHREALALESDGMSEDTDKMSFLNNIPLFNFFIKANTNETLSVMTYETNSKIEAALDTLTNDYNFTNSNIITRESLLPFFNNSGASNSILYDSGYVDYGNNHASVLFRDENNNSNNNINNIIDENTEEYINSDNNISTDNNNYNYLEQMILENRNNNNSSSRRNNIISNNNSANENRDVKNNSSAINNSHSVNNSSNENKRIETNTNTPKSIFDDILKPKENIKRETTTMKPASSTTFSSRPPRSYNNTNQYRSADEHLKNNNTVNNTDKYIEQNNETILSSDSSIKREENRIIKESIKKENNSSSMPAQDRKDIIRSSIYTMTNSLDKANIDYNRVINDMVNPNNNNVIKREDNTKKEDNIKKDNSIKDENNSVNSIKEDIMKKAQNDINNYNIRKANNTVERASLERALKDNNDEGIYLVEYSESTGAITLIFRSRKFNNNSSIKEAIDELLIGATDEENNRNIISCIPKGTKLLDIFVEDNTVYLNFNENFEFNPLGSEGTMVQIYQFVYTATQFEGIDNVIFLINGELHETIGSEGAIENMPFKRFE